MQRYLYINIYNLKYLLTYLILSNFRQRSIDSEKITPPSVIEQAKLIEVEKAETGSVCIINNYNIKRSDFNYYNCR